MSIVERLENRPIFKVTWRKGESDPMTYAEALKFGLQKKNEVRGPITMLCGAGFPEFHPHPDNRGKFFLYKILR